MLSEIKAALLLLAGLLAGCSAGLPQETATRLERMATVQVPSVPLYVQDEFQCGPAALAMVLTWGGAATSPQALTPQVYSPAREGTLQPMLVAAARHQGYPAYEVRGLDTLLAEVAAGHPVIVLENLGLDWIPRWHYSVVVGVHPERRMLVLHSGRAQAEEVSLSRFMRTWQRGGYWGLLVLPPSRLPASLPPLEILGGLAALEGAGRRDAAAAGYAAALKRWPDSLEAHIGLANFHYASGNPAAAVETLMAACRLAPNSGIAWNNLAHALHASGRKAEAVAAAQRAVSLGGALVAEFRATLEEFRAAEKPPRP